MIRVMTVIAMMAICLKMRCITAANSNDYNGEIFISWLQAEESSGDFINDEPDESNSDAAAEVRLACASLRNRRSWRSSSRRAECPLCRDLQTVLGHLLGLD